jgi:glucan phosphoethanolaminetransferase (alkaline phosphatase superfamily)
MSDDLRAWAAVARRLGLALSLSALLPIAFLTAYVALFRAPDSAVAPHFYLIGSLCVAIAGLRLVLSVTLGERVAKATSAALLATTALAMLAYYGLVLIGLAQWGRVVSADLVSAYVPQSGELLRTLGYPVWLAPAAFVALALIAGIAAYGFLHRYDWVTPFRRSVSRPIAAVLGFGLLAMAGLFAAELPHRGWGSRSEPVSLTLFPESGQTAMQSHALVGLRATQLDRAEDAVRAAYQPAKAARQSNVVLIVADALRADHLSLLGYSRPTSPNLDALAKAGALRLGSSVVTACNESSCGLRALAASRYVDTQSTRPITLQEVLRQHGYRAHLVLAGDHTSFYGLRESYGPVDSYFDGASQRARYVNDDRVMLDRLHAIGPWDGQQPVMFQFHLMSTHALGKRFDETPEFGPSENYGGLRSLHAKDAAEFQQRAVNFYDRGVLQADHVVNEILALLKAGGYLRNALVVITGDHGESLGEHGRYTHAKSVWEQALRVPFVVIAFGEAEPGRLDAGKVASQVDIAPTLLRALDMPIPSSWEGRALQDLPAARIVYFQQAQYIGLIDSRTDGKLYKHWHDVGRGEQFTFDLLTDPGETQDLSASIPDALRQEWHRLLLSRSSAIVSDGEERVNQRLGATLEPPPDSKTPKPAH